MPEPTHDDEARAASLHGVRLTHPDKTLADGVTKRDLAEHYARVAERALPHLRDRALTLVRCPDGLSNGCEPGLSVAVPIRWRELGRVDASDAYRLTELPRRLGALDDDPWGDWRALQQRLPPGRRGLSAPLLPRGWRA